MPRRLIALTTLVFALALASCNNAPVSFHGKDITGVMPDLQFQLTGEQGQTVTEQRFQDKAVILFFGYTHCPDFCPTTLTSLAQALKKLPEQTREQIRVMFVSVDPDRDTPELLKKYTGYFGPRIVGLAQRQVNIAQNEPDFRVAGQQRCRLRQVFKRRPAVAGEG